MSYSVKLAASLAAFLVAGCLAPPRQATLPPQSSPRPSLPAEPGRAAPPSASATLLQQARDERAAGALASAESTIERALRIEPNDPWLWIELGEIKRAGGDGAQAAAMGRKALSLAAGDRTAEATARTLLR